MQANTNSTFGRNKILKVNDSGDNYELVDVHELEAYKLRSLGISNDPTVYVGIGTTVSTKLQVSGISTAKFYVGEKVKVFGISTATTGTINAINGTTTKIGTPTATKDYNDDATTVLAANLDATKTQFDVGDAVSLVEKTYIQIDNETMYIRKITGNTLLVNRGEYSTTIDTHNQGTAVNAINAADDALLDLGDDFGFSENRFDFNDGKTYSPSKGVDV